MRLCLILITCKHYRETEAGEASLEGPNIWLPAGFEEHSLFCPVLGQGQAWGRFAENRPSALRPCPLAPEAPGCGFSPLQGTPFPLQPALGDLSSGWPGRTCWRQCLGYAQRGCRHLAFLEFIRNFWNRWV